MGHAEKDLNFLDPLKSWKLSFKNDPVSLETLLRTPVTENAVWNLKGGPASYNPF